MRTLWLFVVIVCLAPPTHAGKLFACRDERGHVAFIDHGCPNARERREIVLAAAPATSNIRADADANQIEAWGKASRARLPASLGGAAHRNATTATRSHGGRPRAESACSNAKSTQAKAERERGFQMRFDERRRLSDAVLSACGLR